MSQSLLMQIARDSIKEILQARDIINKSTLLNEHPLLNQKVFTSIKIYIDAELRGSSQSQNPPQHSLLYETIIHAKRAAFEDSDSTPLTLLEYFHADIEITLESDDSVMVQKEALCI